MIAISDTDPQPLTLQDRLEENARRLELYRAAWKSESMYEVPTSTEPPAKLFHRLRVEHESRENPITWGY